MDDRVKAEGWLDAEAKGLALRTKILGLYSGSKLIAALQVNHVLVGGVHLALQSADDTFLEWDWPQLGPHLQTCYITLEDLGPCGFLASTTVGRARSIGLHIG